MLPIADGPRVNARVLIELLHGLGVTFPRVGI